MSVLIIGAACLSSQAFSQESQFQTKIKADLESAAKGLSSHCGATVTAEWTGGKLGSNPREVAKGGLSSLSSLCERAIKALEDACETSAVVKKKAAALRKVSCKTGKGALSYKMADNSVTFFADRTLHVASSNQGDDLKKKLLADLDQ